jgi:hypothetical protein
MRANDIDGILGIYCRAVKGEPYQDIADDLNISNPTVMKRIKAAHNLLTDQPLDMKLIRLRKSYYLSLAASFRYKTVTESMFYELKSKPQWAALSMMG